ncbi:MAG: iron-sulfur cluster assembly scaffold protein [bacterium]
MSNKLYSDIIMDHWKLPRNYGALSSPDIDIEELNPLCGDKIHLTVVLSNSTISNLLFTSYSCVIAKAASSIFFDSIKGKHIDEIKKITEEAFLSLLPPNYISGRTKCALLPYKAIQKGIQAYETRSSI